MDVVILCGGQGETVMVTYSDGPSNVEIKKLLALHEAHGRFAMETTVQRGSRFGMAIIDSRLRVRSVSEKPKVEGWGEQGFLGSSQKIFDSLEAGDVQILETEPPVRLGAERQLIACEHDGLAPSWASIATRSHKTDL
jgi:glucose-1-phosphate cytidylyltransferase